jgi:hypothetical protein
MTFQHDAAGGVAELVVGGKKLRATVVTAIINMRAALTWKNTRSLVFSAPASEFERWRPVADIVRSSVRFNPRWVLRESQGQQERADFVLKVMDEVRRIDQEMLRKTRVNREEIMNDNYLVLTGQEEFVNPHTKQVEVDTDTYKYRWTTAGGDRYYTNDEDDDPNRYPTRSGYERTPIRKRRNE